MDPLPIYSNGLLVHNDAQMFALVFTDTLPGRPTVDTPQGPVVHARIVGSFRMDAQSYFNALSGMVARWNDFADALATQGVASSPPRFEVVPGGNRAEANRE